MLDADRDVLRSVRTLLAARVFILELCQVVDILVNDDVEVVGLVVRRDVGGRESLRHFGVWRMW